MEWMVLPIHILNSFGIMNETNSYEDDSTSKATIPI